MPLWGQNPSDSPWETRPEAPSHADSWEQPPAESPAWDQPPAESPSWDQPPAESLSWDDPSAESPSWQLPAPAPSADGAWEGRPAEPPRESYEPEEPFSSLEPYEPPTRTPADGNGTNGHHPPAPAHQDFRVAGGQEPDPLTDGPIDSSDIGTPLADESWDSIRRGFDRLKDASNWESLAKGDLEDVRGLPEQDAFDETAAMPIVDPDEDKKED